MHISNIDFPSPCFPEDYSGLRNSVREFIKEFMPNGYGREQQARSWTGFDAEFSKKLASMGWLGMTIPIQYGGHARSAFEKFVVQEELLAAGAPVAAHWIGDRQSAPLILKYGTEEQKNKILPRIASGDVCFCIGMSEPDSGSDLAAVKTVAKPVPGGYVVNGAKLWTTYAHRSHYMILFCRTSKSESRHGGTSQLLVGMDLPGISISPVLDLAGDHHFNEVVFKDVFVPETALIGKEGDGWNQVMSELAFERSGPERFLSSFALLNLLINYVSRSERNVISLDEIGRATSRLLTLRYMSASVSGMLNRGDNPSVQSSIVKDLGALFEQEIPEIARKILKSEDLMSHGELYSVYSHLVMSSPSFSLRGGTREVLRGIISRGLGMR